MINIKVFLKKILKGAWLQWRESETSIMSHTDVTYSRTRWLVTEADCLLDRQKQNSISKAKFQPVEDSHYAYF